LTLEQHGGVSPSPQRTAVPTYEGRPLANPDEPIFDQGLAFDLQTVIDRRRVLKLLAYSGISAGLVAIVGCGTSQASPSGSVSSSSATSGAASGSAAASAASCDTIPEETAGPFPGDGSNGPDVLTQSGVVRKDIRSSFGSSSTVAQGIPLTVRLAIQDASNGCKAMAGAAVYLWHCDREGRYSLYSQGVTNENYLRGARRPAATASSPLPAFSRPATRGAGRTSTSRSIRGWRRRQPPRTGSRPLRSHCPRTSATRSTQPTATARASRT
jgi:hypothetical protein